MEQHVGSSGTHFQEEAVRLRHWGSESEEDLMKERIYMHIVQARLQYENTQVSTLRSELQAHGQA
eukprot:5914676-Prorocentrum_lima.AAC.1